MVGSSGADLPFFASFEQSQPPLLKEGTASITNRLPLGTIFDSRDYIFSTVTNIRTYEWTVKEAEELLDDLLEGSNGLLAGDMNKQDYELSQIVVVPMEWDKDLYGLGNRYDVHDGQQRLVTLCLLFAALRDTFASSNGDEECIDSADTVTELINMLHPKKVRKADVVRIELHKRDNEVLSQILTNNVDSLEMFNMKKMTRANRMIYDNFKMLRGRVESMDKEERLVFLDYLIEKVYMLVCVPESPSIARSLVLAQGKGKDNEPIDDFKGLVCFRYTSNEKEMYKTFDRWDELAAISDIDNRSVGRQTISDACLLRATAELRSKVRKRDEIYALERWLRTYLLGKDGEGQEGNAFFKKKIEPASLKLGQYREGAFNLFGFYAASKGNAHWDSITMRLHFLREMTNNVAATKEVEAVILELLLRANGSEGGISGKAMSLSNLDAYLHKVEQLALWVAVTKPASAKRTLKIFEFLDAIEEEEKEGGDASKIEAISQEDKSSLREALVVSEFGATASGKKIAIALLKRLNAFVLAQKGSASGESINTSGDAYLEFILPKKASKKAWGNEWPDKEEQAQWINKLGNFALISNKATARESNMSFSEKKERLSKEVYSLTLDVANMDTWDSDNLVKRLAAIVGLIDQIWGL